MFAEANTVTPGGTVEIRRPEKAIFREYPIFIKEARKSTHIVDIDGNEYIDYLCGWGPIVLDFIDDEINEAVFDRIKRGFCFSYVQEEKLELEKLLQRIIPCCQKTLIAKTGSDATSIALRIAKAQTGKNKVISWGYHGWGTGREKIPTGVPLVPAEGDVYIIAGNEFLGNKQGSPLDYTEGAHVYFY